MAYQDRIREARNAVGMTQEQLANKLGIATSTLNGYEKGNREPNISDISKILAMLNIDDNYLYHDEMEDLHIS